MFAPIVICNDLAILKWFLNKSNHKHISLQAQVSMSGQDASAKRKRWTIHLNSKLRFWAVAATFLIWGCLQAADIGTPEMIGAKERMRVISGKQAAATVNRLHRGEVAGENNVIAEYGGNEKDLLYVTFYRDPQAARKAFDAMIDKMRAAKNTPFFHLMPLQKYRNPVYITLGMGAVHYIYVSGKFLLWLQTTQSFGDQLPQRLLELYPA